MIPESLSGNRHFSDYLRSDTMDNKMKISNGTFDSNSSLISIDQFKKMDNLAIEQFFLPIEIMMENAG